MWSLVRLVTSIAISATLLGCAGTNFVRPDSEGLKNGETTYTQLVARMGQPYREGTVLKNEKTLKTSTYAYAAAGGKPVRDNVTPARSLGFYFLSDALVGHEFISSWAEDHTDFDESKVSSIVKGKTTRADVIKQFGKPGGYYIYPMIKETKGEAAVYAYAETRGTAFNLSFYHKLLIVTFDTAGIVSNVEYNSSGNK